MHRDHRAACSPCKIFVASVVKKIKMQMKFTWIIVLLFACSNQQKATNNVAPSFKKEITETLRQQIMQEADWAMKQEPITVTAETSPRSAGGKHDFFSEGDYWWPN